MAKISIIVPLYNKQRYVKRCLESILCQTYKDFEVIVINDGSTDESLSTVNSFVDSRLRVFDVPNGGVSRARNLGLQNAKGEYILFVDADDWIDGNYVANIAHSLLQNPADLLLFSLSAVDASGHVRKLPVPTECPEELLPNYMHIQDVESPGFWGWVSNKCIRRDFLEKHLLRFDEHKRLAEDLSFWTDVLSHNPSLSVLKENGYFYLQAADNSSVYNRNVDYFSLIDIWKSVYRMLEKQGYIEQNQFAIYSKLYNLCSVHFLELAKISLSKVKTDLRLLHERMEDLPEFWENYEPRDILGRCVKTQSSAGLYLYLCFRRTYHYIAHHHA